MLLERGNICGISPNCEMWNCGHTQLDLPVVRFYGFMFCVFVFCRYIAKHPDSVPPKTTMDQFSFAIPRPLPGVCPQLTPNGKKLTLPQAAHEVHNEQEQLTPQSVDNVPQGDDQAAVPHSDTLLLPSVDQGGPISGNGNVQLLTQVTLPSPQRPQPSKRSHPESPVMTPTRRTKQQVKKDRLGQESLVVSEADEQPPPDASTSSGYAESP